MRIDRSYIKGGIGALIVVIVIAISYHLYMDHKALHNVFDMIIKAQASQGQGKNNEEAIKK